jgi:hypothetical protein
MICGFGLIPIKNRKMTISKKKKLEELSFIIYCSAICIKLYQVYWSSDEIKMVEPT